MNPEDKNKQLYSVRYTLSKGQIEQFVNGLREIQEEMIEAVVERKAEQGYPEANEVIRYIMQK